MSITTQKYSAGVVPVAAETGIQKPQQSEKTAAAVALPLIAGMPLVERPKLNAPVTVIMRLVDALLPNAVQQKIQNNEDCMVAGVRLILNTIIKAENAIRTRKYDQLDPLGGDGACEMRAYLVNNLVTSKGILAELAKLKIVSEDILKTICQRNGKKDLSTSEYLKQKIEVIQVTAETALLLQVYCLATVKTIKRNRETNKIVREYTGAEAEVNDYTKLTVLSKPLQNITVRDAMETKGIIGYLQKAVSKASAEYLQQDASKIVARGEEMTKAALATLQNMMVPKYQKDGTLDYNNYYGLKTVVLLLRESKGMMLVRKMIPAPDSIQKSAKKESLEKAAAESPQKHMSILYRPKVNGGPFELVSEEEEAKLLDGPVVVFESAIKDNISRAQLAAKIAEIGLQELVLMNGAIITDESEITDEEARKEIVSYQQKAAKAGYIKSQGAGSDKHDYKIENPFLLACHLYCNSLGEELSREKGGNK